jgi:type III pantothenate kinase
MTTWLLIDNSNTRTKFALASPERLLEWRGILHTAKISRDSLAHLLDSLAFDAAVLCSVVPVKAEILRGYLQSRGPLHEVTCHSDIGLGIDYPEPERIGADRLANAAGVVAGYGAPAVVIDFGTAVTFDVISEAPCYCGGVIAPGLGAMNEYLTHRTALLPPIQLDEPPSAIGKSTLHAMQAGAVLGYRGLVKEILAGILREMTGRPKIVATGGDAALIARGVPEIETVDPDLTLEGLRQIALRNLQA